MSGNSMGNGHRNTPDPISPTPTAVGVVVVVAVALLASFLLLWEVTNLLDACCSCWFDAFMIC